MFIPKNCSKCNIRVGIVVIFDSILFKTRMLRVHIPNIFLEISQVMVELI
jgi:hypothetical protein